MALTPTYIPSPNWDIHADSDIVVLGRLIKDPYEPESKLRAFPIAPSTIYEGKKTDWQTTLDEIRSAKIGLWAQCMQYLEGGVSFSIIKSKLENHKFDTLETTYFLPDDEYFDRVLSDLDVQAYFEVTGRRKPVYLITGLKIARGASASTETSTEKSTQAELKFDGTSSAIPINMGDEIDHDLKTTRGVSYSGSTDYIFAYRLTRIKPSRWGDGSKNKAFVKGAAFGSDEEEDVTDIKARDAFDLEEVSLGDDDINEAFLDTVVQADQDKI
ncbi:hypothetical protein INS49_012716 [Diaporthe citri]|uniref:uncharacterized protein n=1 Tax=Diaporthe citri TaxID=83186 RepID=UPI001C7F33B7|nr:uncharacterized protein INS49_012716 [Diaporthe citri]KAG6359196.1 hypothetical protein INS49_012716 [Diaporthe citri]